MVVPLTCEGTLKAPPSWCPQVRGILLGMDFENVFMYFCLFRGDGWFPWFPCQETLRVPPCLWSQVRRICGVFERVVGLVWMLRMANVDFGSVSDVFCLLREDGGFDSLHVNGPSWLLYPSVLRWEEFAGFLSGSRETGLELQHGFFLGAVLTSGCLLGVSVWIQCRWDGVQRCGGGTEETDYTRGTCSSCVGRRWKHCGDRACSGWSLSLTLNQIYHFPNFAFRNLCMERRIHLNLEALDGFS